MRVSEIFLSIQGESSYVGIPCIFVRLAGCNLACSWCDTEYARKSERGKEISTEDVFKEIKKFKAWIVEITGGEPLIQPEAKELAKMLLDAGYKVLLETNGSISLEGLDPRLVKIVDVKCPSSGYEKCFVMDNLEFITPEDEMKFVIGDGDDYAYAKRFMEDYIKDLTDKVLFAPVKPRLHPADLAEWILKDGLRVRLQIQLHSYIWDERRKR